jgi:hypothetical protein
MRQTCGGCWRLLSFLTELRSLGAVAVFLLFFFPYSCADATAANIFATRGQTLLVKPDQYNVEACQAYFNKLKPGLARSGGDYNSQEKYTIQTLCEARPANLLADGAAADDISAGDTLTSRTLRA